MKTLIIFNREPYDSTDVTWNGLRLADKLLDAGSEVRIFLMNDAVDLARDVCRPPENYDQDLSAMLKALITRVYPLRYAEPVWRAAAYIKIIPTLTAQNNPQCPHW